MTRATTVPAPLADSHDRSRFASRHQALNDWLLNKAPKAEGRSARTYVVCVETRVVGYHCIAAGAVAHAAAPGRIRRNMPDPVPMMVIGRLAVDQEFERRGIGGGLLKDALQRILGVASIVGVRGVLVHAIDDEAVSFYLRFGFVPFPAGTRSLFLPIETIVSSVAGPR